MADSKPMREDDLAAIVAAKITGALGYQGGRLSQERQKAERYYKGEPFGNEMDGRSQVVSRDVAEAVDAMMPSLCKIFTSGDEVVRFEPTRQEEEEQAKQATDYVNWIWNQQNDGFSIFFTWFKDALLKKSGVVKIWWDDTPEKVKERYVGLTQHERDLLLADENIELVEEKAYPDPQAQRLMAMAMLGELTPPALPPPPQQPQLPPPSPGGPQMPGEPTQAPQPEPPVPGPVDGQAASLPAPQNQGMPGAAAAAPSMPPAAAPLPAVAGAAGAPPLPAALPQIPDVYDVTVMRTNKSGRVKVVPVPTDEFLIDRRAVSLDAVPFLAHRLKKTVSEACQMFPDKAAKIKDVDKGDDQDFNMERLERFQDEDEYPYRDDGVIDPTTREIWITESYIRADYDGDGVAELRKVTVAGSANTLVLDNEEVDDHPFAALTPIPMPHKFFGMSIADQTMDLQLIKSTLFRGMLDSQYLSLAPQMGAVEGQVNLDDLLNRRPGGIVRIKQPTALVPITTQPVAADALQGIAYLDTVREQRTGVQRFTAGPGADALNSAYTQTATGAGMVENASQERLELIARNFAETGVKRAFRRILALVCQHQDRIHTVKLRGKWVDMDPRDWSDRMDMTVNVGLGTGNKQQQIAAISNLLLHDQQIIELQGGMNGPLVYAKNIYNKLAKLVEASGLRSVQPYYNEPGAPPPEGTPPPHPPMPPPEIMKTQMQIQADQATTQLQLQADQQKTMAQIQADMASQEAERQHKERLALADIQSKQALEVTRLNQERELRLAELAHQQQRLGLDHAVATTSAILDDKKIETDAALKASQLQAENARTAAEHQMRQTEFAHTAETHDREFGFKAATADREHGFKVATTPGAQPAPKLKGIELVKDKSGRSTGARKHYDDGSSEDIAIGHAPAQAQ
jgi:hypothetical protein